MSTISVDIDQPSRQTHLSRGVGFILLTWPILFRLLDSLNLPGGSIALTAFAGALCMLFFLSQNRLSVSNTAFTVFACCYIVWMFTTIMRGSEFLTSQNALLSAVSFAATAVFFIVAICGTSSEVRQRMVYLGFLALPTFLLFNIVLHIFGDKPHQVSYSNLNSYFVMFGIYTPRLDTLFLIIGANTIGMIACLASFSTFVMWRKKSIPFVVAFSLCSTSAYVLLLTENRAAMVVLLICVAMHYLCGVKLIGLVAKLTIVLTLFSPWILYDLFVYMNTSGSDVFVRSSELGETLGAGTGRTYIWHAAFQALYNNPVTLIIGNGVGGQATSGLSEQYQWIFVNDPVAHTLHSAVLQIIFDAGLIGAFLHYGLIFLAVRRIHLHSWLDEVGKKLCLTSLIMIMTLGWTETTGTFYHIESFYFLLFLLILALPPARFIKKANGGRDR